VSIVIVSERRARESSEASQRLGCARFALEFGSHCM
jgi:hypothetical protein